MAGKPKSSTSSTTNRTKRVPTLAEVIGHPDFKPQPRLSLPIPDVELKIGHWQR